MPATKTPQIREFRYGDMGAIVSAQAELYDRSHGWRGEMETLLLQVCADFLRNHVPGRTNCWVAELDDRIVGAIFCCDSGDNAAQLRLLHVDEAARGHGLGRQLVTGCVDFARAAGYDRIWLWTHAVLLPARRLYADAGFRITATAMHDSFGKHEAGETWTLVF